MVIYIVEVYDEGYDSWSSAKAFKTEEKAEEFAASYDEPTYIDIVDLED